MKKTKNIIWIIALILVIVLIGIVAFGYYKKATMEVKNPIATMEVENFGTIKIELYPDLAPETVANFIALANRGFYDGLTFHRVVKDFMIQGGDPEGNGTGGPGYSIKGEFTKNKFQNDLKHTEGVLSMARSQNKNSAGSQFFIMSKDTPSLDGNYAAFGKVVEGMDVVDAIASVKTDRYDRPLTEQVIKKAYII